MIYKCLRLLPLAPSNDKQGPGIKDELAKSNWAKAKSKEQKNPRPKTRALMEINMYSTSYEADLWLVAGQRLSWKPF